MSKKILITGATGLLGQHLVKQAKGSNYEIKVLIRNLNQKSYFTSDVECFVGDIRSKKNVVDAVKGCNYVIHACCTHKFNVSFDELYSTNVIGTQNICEAVEINSCEKLVYTSAISTLRNTNLISYNNIEKLPSRKRSSISKLHSESEVLNRIKMGLPAIVINPSYFIGPFDFNPSPIRLWIPYGISNRIYVVPSGGFNILCANEVAKKHIWALTNGNVGNRYPVVGFDITYFDYAKLINQIAGHPFNPVIASKMILSIFARGKVFDQYVAKLVSEKNYYGGFGTPNISFEIFQNYITETMDWFSNNSPLIKKIYFLKYLKKRFI